jgi:hypothetical protein
MKNHLLRTALAFSFLLLLNACNEKDRPGASGGCFNDSPLETIPWAKDQLALFQRPKSGPLQVSVYSYKNEVFLVFANAFDSGPTSHIFDCSGTTLGKRGIHYNEFFDEARLVKTLLTGTY